MPKHNNVQNAVSDKAFLDHVILLELAVPSGFEETLGREASTNYLGIFGMTMMLNSSMTMGFWKTHST